MRILSRFGGNGLVTCTSKTWKKQRKMVAPSLQSKSLETYVPVFNKQTRILVNLLKEFADGNTFDVMIPLVACTAEIISETAIGSSLNGQLKEENIAEMLKRANHLILERIMRPWLILDTIYDLTTSGKEQRKVEELLCRTGNNLISRKLEEYRDMKSSGSITDEWMSKGNTIDHYIRTSDIEGTELDEQLLKDEVYTTLVAGSDTTATTVCYTLMLLGLHPTIQDAVFEELKEVFADDWERDVTSEDVKQMKYLSRVIKEAMRLFPAVTVIAREVQEELELSTCTLPAGCLCLVVSYFVHRDPRYFPDPERFDPDRFLHERSKDRHPYSYIPFGAGPRICVGFKYAERAMYVMLGTVLRKYRVLPVITHEDLQKLELGLVLRPVSNFLIKMLPREQPTTMTTTDTPL
ncbi:LOW QUALITY PROTEIN: cytochrome P450 4C1 [Anabrus simplex]|uniref:LOW QUALITY PROTEIN: cytochrome P450 4C1 n=1 Tax=Anabrus simplex TaxID=316456 RepID=UPI0035A2E6A9